jgi:hypothetical protein
MGTITAGLATSPAPARSRLRLLPGGVAEGAGRSQSPAGARGGERSARGAHPAGRARQRGGLQGGAPVRSPSRQAVRVAGRPGLRSGGVPARRGSVRLTRRGRLVLRLGVLLLALLLALVLALLLTRPASAGAQRHVVQARYHVVLPGETLWSIAGEIAPRADRRDVVAEIVELNALPGSGVDAGQRIALPPGS